ncbi:hypothetical protein [Cohaesibacter marisflavi]|uniref:hypothetical protein n=1 Tax=Cohaesibacter marisflavi TaxID=655353 RepID=UPI0029C63F10|nr:hypothetical protein [Cohaesibacter marisflavi]
MDIEDNNPADTGTVNDEALTLDDATNAFDGLDDDPEEDTADQTTDQGEDDEQEQADQEADTEEDLEGDGGEEIEEDDQAEDTTEGSYAGDDMQVKLPDGTVATVEELKNGHLMQSDYTRKVQALAQDRQATQNARTEATQWGGYFQQQATRLEQALDNVKALIPDPSLQSQDPLAYMQGMQRFTEQLQETLGKSRNIRQRSQQHQAQQMQTQRQEAFGRELEALTTQNSTLLDREKQKAYIDEVEGFLKSEGYGNEEILGFIDHRAWQIVHDAMQYRADKEKQSQAKRKVKDVPKVGSNKRAKTSGERRRGRNAQAKSRLKSSGNVRDAAAVFMDIEDEE